MASAPPVVEIRPVDDFTSLAPVWQALERQSDGSFFQSWAWTGCLAEARFPDPWLLTARRGDRVVALGLFNRGPAGRFGARPLLLGESGDAALDTIFIEHNGLLLDRTEGDDLSRACWAALAAHAELGKARWRLSGVPQSVADALPGDRAVRITARRPAFSLDLAGPAAPVLDRLSANTRQRLRQSLRAWEKIGPLKLDIAAGPDEAEAYLQALKVLHQHYWVGRGKPGAFAEPFFERFHRALIRRPGQGQSVDLIRVSAGDRTLGYLYNLVQDGWVAAYQSGFDFGPDADRLRPGLICHLLAAQHYRAASMRLYDFLGGEAQYKRSFADTETELLWLDVRPRSALARIFSTSRGQRGAH